MSRQTTAEVATELRVSEWWLLKQAKRGVVSPMRLNNAANAPLRWSRADVQQLVAALTPAPTPKPTRRRHKRRAAS